MRSGYRVSFKPRGGKGNYLAVAALAIKTPAWVRGDSASRLRRDKNRADYVVIVPAELTDGAQALADHQTAKGLKAKVVLLEDIYDEFDGGIEDPLAIQRFLEYAWNHWRIAPRYAALAGDGSYDHRDLLGSGDSLVPVLLTATPDGLFAADNLYGRFGNEQKIAIGRIPAHDNAELLGYVEKLQSWETGLDGSGLVQLMADDDDAAGPFTDDSDALKALIPAHQLAAGDIYLKDYKAGNGGIDAAPNRAVRSIGERPRPGQLPRSWGRRQGGGRRVADNSRCRRPEQRAYAAGERVELRDQSVRTSRIRQPWRGAAAAPRRRSDCCLVADRAVAERRRDAQSGLVRASLRGGWRPCFGRCDRRGAE
jgi:Peptidase family C25